jgi:hypothetical protein
MPAPYTAFTYGDPKINNPTITLPGGIQENTFSGQYTSSGGGGLSGEKSFTFAGRKRIVEDNSINLISCKKVDRKRRKEEERWMHQI